MFKTRDDCKSNDNKSINKELLAILLEISNAPNHSKHKNSDSFLRNDENVSKTSTPDIISDYNFIFDDQCFDLSYNCMQNQRESISYSMQNIDELFNAEPIADDTNYNKIFSDISTANSNSMYIQSFSSLNAILPSIDMEMNDQKMDENTSSDVECDHNFMNPFKNNEKPIGKPLITSSNFPSEMDDYWSDFECNFMGIGTTNANVIPSILNKHEIEIEFRRENFEMEWESIKKCWPLIKNANTSEIKSNDKKELQTLKSNDYISCSYFVQECNDNQLEDDCMLAKKQLKNYTNRYLTCYSSSIPVLVDSSLIISSILNAFLATESSIIIFNQKLNQFCPRTCVCIVQYFFISLN